LAFARGEHAHSGILAIPSCDFGAPLNLRLKLHHGRVLRNRANPPPREERDVPLPEPALSAMPDTRLIVA